MLNHHETNISLHSPTIIGKRAHNLCLGNHFPLPLVAIKIDGANENFAYEIIERKLNKIKDCLL